MMCTQSQAWKDIMFAWSKLENFAKIQHRLLAGGTSIYNILYNKMHQNCKQ